MNALSTITIMPSTKEQLASYKATMKSEILSGSYDTLEVLKMLKFTEKAVSDILKDSDIESAIMDEATKYGKSFERFGCKFAIKDVGVKYDYSVCQDADWDELNAEITRLTEARKSREAFLQNIPIEGVIDPGTGGYIYPPARSGASKVTITI